MLTVVGTCHCRLHIKSNIMRKKNIYCILFLCRNDKPSRTQTFKKVCYGFIDSGCTWLCVCVCKEVKVGRTVRVHAFCPDVQTYCNSRRRSPFSPQSASAQAAAGSQSNNLSSRRFLRPPIILVILFCRCKVTGSQTITNRSASTITSLSKRSI